MTTSERLGHTLVAIPVAHVLGSAFFLWSYCLGFGANLVIFASASDLLSVSISDMVRVYALALVLPAAVTLIRVTSANPYAVDMANALPVEQQAGAHANNRKMRKALNWAAFAIFVVFTGRAAYSVISGEQFPYHLIWAALQVPAIVLWMTACESRGYSNWTFEAGTLLGGFIISLFCIGASKGQSDRFIPYKDAVISHTACSKFVILRQVSNKYLSIMPDGSRALISEDCKVVFRVPSPRGQPLYGEAKPSTTLHPTQATKGNGRQVAVPAAPPTATK
jgi:hypothetical protein